MSKLTRLILVLSLASGGACARNAASPPGEGQPDAPASQPASAPAAWDGKTLHRGAAFTVAQATALSDLLASPEKFSGQTFKTQGVVARACSKAGCWMELHPEGGDRGVRVTFKDYAFFVPTDSSGAKATVEGVLAIKKLSADDAAHLEGEGAKLTRNEAGEVIEIALVASGVELQRAQ